MPNPQLTKECDVCGTRTLHTRVQEGKPDPPRVVTEYTCFQCETVKSEVQRLFDQEDEVNDA